MSGSGQGREGGGGTFHVCFSADRHCEASQGRIPVSFESAIEGPQLAGADDIDEGRLDDVDWLGIGIADGEILDPCFTFNGQQRARGDYDAGKGSKSDLCDVLYYARRDLCVVAVPLQQ